MCSISLREIGSDGPHIVVNSTKIVGLEEAETFLEQDICERALLAGRSVAIHGASNGA